ncbi:MAG: tRNA pseudouridine(38-40) synthase TruA [Acidobacteriota bacterium]
MVALLTLSYRGTAYAGWQRQDNALAVQQVVEEALARLLGLPEEEIVRIVGASRTDAGVHARGQRAHLDLAALGRPDFPLRGLVHGTNHHLPEDVRVLAAKEVPEGFHARKSAVSKQYHYRLSRAEVLSPLDSPFAVKVSPTIEIDRLNQAAALLPGRHDFTAFTLAGAAPGDRHREMFAAGWTEAGDELHFRIEGEGFLRGMVRSLVGTMMEVGLGERSVEDFANLLRGAERGEAGPTAPAQGLVLEWVRYED